jgi:CRISPR/Cas system CMR-associated protein Cmr3 (group 5 of RAMP superfamily)
MIFLRYILICIIGYLIVRSFIRWGVEEKSSTGKHFRENKNKATDKKISKEVGEYIDYEEIKK